MPTERKVKSVETLSKLLSDCTIAISTDFTGMSVGSMTDLRRALRDNGVQYKVIKNNLLYLAADDAGKPLVKDIVEGATGMAFGFDDPTVPARAIAEFIRASRAPLSIRGAVLDDRVLEAAEVDILAQLPSKDVLVARLLGQLLSPVTSLVYVLNGPVSALARVLHAAAEAKGNEDTTTDVEEPVAETDGGPDEQSESDAGSDEPAEESDPN